MGGFYLNSEKGESTPQTNLLGSLSNISVSTFYKHIRTLPLHPLLASISISLHLRQFIFLPLVSLFPIQSRFFHARFFPIFFKKTFEGNRHESFTVFFQFYTKNLEIYKKEEKSIAGLKFNPKDIVIISREFSKIEESIERLNSKTWVCVQEISRRIAIWSQIVRMR